jgi:uncharacterized protein (DUF1330 family)
VGDVAVQSLHAQAKPPGYVIAEIDVKNKDPYAKEFLPLAMKTLENAGAKYFVRGGKTIALEGTPPPSRVVVLQF